MELLQLLQQCIQMRASDLHLVSGLRPRMRVDGELQSCAEVLEAQLLQRWLRSVLNETQHQHLQTYQDVDFAYTLADVSRFRGHAFYTRHGLSMVLRVIPNHIPSLADIQFPAVSQQLVQAQQGLIVVTGPTGCGKSTTLAALVHAINAQRSVHIVTLEDPIEFIHNSQKSLVSQREIAQHTPNYQRALRAILREDPDVILIGELRDLETIRIALTAAETGHLVLATLHTCNAPQAVSRMVDVFPAAEKNSVQSQLAEILKAMIAQRLVQKSAGGRCAEYEILLTNPAVRHLIRENKIEQLYSVMQTHRGSGMQVFKPRSGS